MEDEIKKALRLKKSLIEDQNPPIITYNYSAIRDRLLRKGIKLSVPTIILRANPIKILILGTYHLILTHDFVGLDAKLN